MTDTLFPRWIARSIWVRTSSIAQNKGEHKELMGAHARDELGISENFRARPIQAALASAGSFAVGAALPSEQPCLSLYL
ncbi:MAG: VIT1/CCC1 transporter family protein [Candidatus Sulfotelmatobacter sp.]|jgi:hypothetical protein